MGDSTDEASPTCRVCSDPVDGTDNRRVVSVVEGSEAIHYHFCSDACLDAWES